MHKVPDKIVDCAAELIRAGMKAPKAARQALINFGIPSPSNFEISTVCIALRKRRTEIEKSEKNALEDANARKAEEDYRKASDGW